MVMGGSSCGHWSAIANGTRQQRRRCWLQTTPMHQPWQEFGIKTDIIEFPSGEYLANRPTAAACETRMQSSGLHPITNLKRLCHRVCLSPSQRRACARPQDGCAVSVHLKGGVCLV